MEWGRRGDTVVCSYVCMCLCDCMHVRVYVQGLKLSAMCRNSGTLTLASLFSVKLIFWLCVLRFYLFARVLLFRLESLFQRVSKVLSHLQ